MKTLNLTNLEKSDIKYQISRFPDGQQNIVIDKNDCYESAYGYLLMSHKDCKVQIKSRLNNWLDLELIVCTVASLCELGVEEIHLYVPYIIGARSDRKFEEGGNNYIKDVIAPIINSLNFKSVTCIDPHSDVLEACIKGFRKESNIILVSFAIKNICNIGNEVRLFDYGKMQNNLIIVSPDAGASKKIYKLAEQIGYKGDIITCSKDRDVDGKLTKTIVPINGEHVQNDIIIIDDICDGGATFINIMKVARDEGYIGKAYLIATHSIFSKGTNELLKYFDRIYTTNSYKEHDVEKVKVLNIF